MAELTPVQQCFSLNSLNTFAAYIGDADWGWGKDAIHYLCQSASFSDKVLLDIPHGEHLMFNTECTNLQMLHGILI